LARVYRFLADKEDMHFYFDGTLWQWVSTTDY